MILTTILFYLFSLILIVSALVVVSARNAVHSVMFLILAFFNAAALFVMLKAEFLAMLLIIVYVGAIAVLFLFVVMMLNIDKDVIKKKVDAYLPITALLAIILIVEMFLIIKVSISNPPDLFIKAAPIVSEISNTEEIGNVLYTKFILPFQLSGAILFVAMVGAIVLTSKDKTRLIKKQNIGKQVNRSKDDSIKLVKAKSGQGVDI